MSDQVPIPPDEPKAQRPLPKMVPLPNLQQEDAFGSSAPKLRDLDAMIERELSEAMGGLSDKEMYGEPQRGPRTKPQPGAAPARKKARVVGIRGKDVFLDVPGNRSQGVLPLSQFEEGPPKLGDEFEVGVEGYDRANGLVLLSREGAAVHVDWSSVAVGMLVEARVTGHNKGGLEVEVNGIRGFMPISQVDLYRTEAPEQFLNQRLRCIVSDVDPTEKNLVVSRRALLEKEREEKREKLWTELAEGQVREGIVRGMKEFGAFIDLGGVDGLLHIGEMSWTRLKDPAEAVQPGQTVRVVILKLDHEKRKVSLGMKQLTTSPWDTVHLNYPEQSTVKGKVSRIAEFGAFVELEPGIEGLVHISELSPQRVRRVRDVVQEGLEVQVVVLQIDKPNRRIALSLKAAIKPVEAEPEPEEAPQEAQPPRVHATPLRGGLNNRGMLPG